MTDNQTTNHYDGLREWARAVNKVGLDVLQQRPATAEGGE